MRRPVGAHHLTDERAERASQLQRPTWCIALPKRQSSWSARGGGDQYLVVGDLLDPPTRGAQGEDVADSSLVDHLLIELANSTPGCMPPRRIPFTDQEHTEEPAIRDRATGVTASRWAPGRAVSTPVSRCQIRRGLSSANSSLG